MRKPILIIMIAASIIASILLSSSVKAVPNNPGHDTLYVLKLGDSNVTGSINISGNLTATLIQATSRFFGPNLDIRGDGSSAGSVNQIIGTTTGLEISTPGDLILNKAATGGTVYVGSTGTTTALNITGGLYVQSSTAIIGGVSVCLANGSNCPDGLSGANVTSVNVAGSTPLTINSTTGNIMINITIPACAGTQKLTYDGNSFSCAADEEGSGSDGTGGWTNTTTTTATSLDVNVDSGTLYVNSTGNDFVGVGTAAPVTKLEVQSTSSPVPRGILSSQYTDDNSGANLWFRKARSTSSSPSALQSGDYLGGIHFEGYGTGGYSGVSGGSSILVRTTENWNSTAKGSEVTITTTANGTTTRIDRLTILNSGNIGLSTSTPTQRLDVNGSINVSGTSAKLYTPEICLAGSCQTSWPAGASPDGTGGWANTTTTTSTSLDVNVDSGTLYVNSTGNNFIGMGTSAPRQKLDVISPYTQIHFGHEDSGLGGYLMALSAGQAIISSNANYNGSNWIARSTSASQIVMQGGQIGFYGASSLTEGATYTITSRMYILDTGEIGIGTITPTAKLDVNGSINISGTSAKIYTPEICLAGSCQTSWPSGADGTGGWTNTTTTTATSLNVNVDSGTLYVNASDNKVGIGTTQPDGLLTVQAQARTAESIVFKEGSNMIAEISDTGGASTFGKLALYENGIQRISLTAESVSYIHNSLGLGVNPTEKLHVAGSILLTGSINISNATGKLYTPEICLAGSCQTSWPSGADGTGGWTNTTTTTETSLNVNVDSGTLYVNSTGNNFVGIGTEAPENLLHVDGSSKFVGNTTYEIPASTSIVCFEKFIGAVQNYTRCIDSDGYITEQFGVFEVS